MKTSLLALSLALAASTVSAETTLRVHYAIPTIWADTQAQLADAYMAQNPDVKIVLDGPAENYSDGVQRLLRESVAGNLPDIAYVALNNWRILEARGLTQPLDELIGDEAAFEAKGFTPALRSLGQYQDKQHALATSASTLVMYVNPVLVEQAGGSMQDFPTDIDGLIELAAKIDGLSETIDGIWIDRQDWRFQSLLGSYGGRPMNADETDITFDDEAGLKAAQVYARFANEAGMKLYGENDARQAFPAGTLGIMMESSSLLNAFTQGAGDRFEVVVKPFPIAAEDKSTVYLPTGGSAVVMLTEDEEKQKAAWDYISFVTGPEGAKIIVENTGYAPTNALVLQDNSYLGQFYADNANAKIAHEQVATYSGPWYSFPGDQGVAVTDLITAAMTEIADGADAQTKLKELAESMRKRLGMK